MSQTTWEQARELVRESLRHIPADKHHDFTDIGSFMYDGQFGDFHFRILREDNNRETFALFTPSSAGRIIQYFYELAVIEPQKRFSGLGQHGIREASRDRYPLFEYTWSAGSLNPDHAGKLTYLRVELDSETFANYYLGAHQDLRVGDQTLLAQLPRTIDGVPRILNTEIPWHIDYKQRAQEIFALSYLPDFTLACRKAFILH